MVPCESSLNVVNSVAYLLTKTDAGASFASTCISSELALTPLLPPPTPPAAPLAAEEEATEREEIDMLLLNVDAGVEVDDAAAEVSSLVVDFSNPNRPALPVC